MAIWWIAIKIFVFLHQGHVANMAHALKSFTFRKGGIVFF